MALTEAAPAAGDVVEVASYDELCDTAPLDTVLEGAPNSWARLTEGGEVRPAQPADLNGTLDAARMRKGKGAGSRPETWWAEPFQETPLYAVCLKGPVLVGGRQREAPSPPRRFRTDGQGRLVRDSSRAREAVRALPGELTTDTDGELTFQLENRYGHLLVTADGRLVEDSFRLRDRRRTLPARLLTVEGGKLRLREELRPTRTLGGLHYHLGALLAHFGHFLLEGMARLWLVDRLADREVTFISYEPVQEWQRELLGAAGVDPARVVTIDQPVRVERLIVPSPSHILHSCCSPAQNDVWTRVGDRLAGPSDVERVYLSRARFRKRGRVSNEPELEEVFAQHGFRVVHPETLPLGEQVTLVRGARLLASSIGSAAHQGCWQAPAGRKLLLGPRNFAFRDDQLISHYRGGELAYFFVPPEPTTEKVHARNATCVVDPAELGERLPEWVGDS